MTQRGGWSGVRRDGLLRRTLLRHRERLLRRALWCALVVVLVGSAAVGGAQLWIRRGASGHVFDPAHAPSAPVVIVLGAEVRAGRPKPILAGRLDLTAELVRTGRAGAVLISGDAAGGSGNETAVMTEYLIARGVPRDRMMTDPHGLDTYDTCKRAHDLYGITRALLVSQSFHLSRAVALCRHVGIDADGVLADCASCSRMTWARNRARDLLAGVKAAVDVARDRPPAIASIQP